MIMTMGLNFTSRQVSEKRTHRIYESNSELLCYR